MPCLFGWLHSPSSVVTFAATLCRRLIHSWETLWVVGNTYPNSRARSPLITVLAVLSVPPSAKGESVTGELAHSKVSAVCIVDPTLSIVEPVSYTHLTLPTIYSV